jgi:hypothetical protein
MKHSFVMTLVVWKQELCCINIARFSLSICWSGKHFVGPRAEEREGYALLQALGSLFPNRVNTGSYPHYRQQTAAFKFDSV